MSYYKCARCNYIVQRNSDMIRHLGRKNKCIPNINSYKLTDEEIHKSSLILQKNNDISIFNEELKKDKFGKSDSINGVKCENCNKLFARKYNLTKHLIKTCKGNKKSTTNTLNEIGDNTQSEKQKENNLFVENQINVSNQTNNTNSNSNNNIIIINQNNLQSFDNKWTTEHLDNYIRQMILLSDHKYTNLLDEILKNKDNLNVIINKDSDYGLVYKDDDKMYVNMKTREIIDKSIEKLYEQLNIFYSDLIDTNIVKVNTNIIEQEKQVLDDKYKEFCTNNNVKSSVRDLLTKIYEKNNTEALGIADKLINYGNNMDKEIGF